MTAAAAPPIAREEYLARQRTIADDARAAGLDGILAWSTCGSALDGYANVFWLTNHYSPVPRVYVDIAPFMTGWGQTAVVIPADGEPPILVVESADYRRDLVVAERVRSSFDVYAAVADALAEAGLQRGRVGLAGHAMMPVAAWWELRKRWPDIEWQDADPILYARRMIKSPAEIELMRRASTVGTEIQNAMLELAAPGRTDDDLARAGITACLDGGGVPWDFAFASGPHSGHGYWCRMPPWDRHRPYEAGDIVHPDAYGAVDGYFYDLQRSVVVGGDPSPAQRRLLDGVVDVVHALCAACTPGTPLADVARLRRTWMREHGFERGPEHAEHADELLGDLEGAGHGMGCGFELPWVDGRSPEVAEPGMTIALEVYLSDPTVGTVAHEEVVLVTSDGPEMLTAGCPARRW